MIELTKINGQAFFLNCELIETIEEKPDTIITLFTGKKLIVKEPMNEIFKKFIEFKNKAYTFNAVVPKFEEWKKEISRSREECGC